MVEVTFKYTDYGHKETTEFREYVKNLVGWIGEGSQYGIRFGVESDPMFDDKIVGQLKFVSEDVAFDVVNHFMMDREVNQNLAFDIDISSISIYVDGSDRIVSYLNARSFSHLYERIEIAENALQSLSKKYDELKASHEKMAGFIQLMGVDKFPDIVREVINSMEAEGHSCKTNINQILNRKVH